MKGRASEALAALREAVEAGPLERGALLRQLARLEEALGHGRHAEVITRVAAAEADGEALQQALLDGLLSLSGAERAFLVGSAGAEMRLLAARNFDGIDADLSWLALSQTILHDAVERREPAFVPDARREPRYREQASIARLGILSVAVLPLVHERVLLGAVYLDSRRVSRLITSDGMAAAADLVRCLAPLFYALSTPRAFAPVGAGDSAFESLVGEAPQFREAVRLARLAATSEAPVLLLGETGTGKELFARAIHEASARSGGPFAVVNCAAIPTSLAESELFGFESGSFTGARGARPGRARAADGGTLLLDEVGDLDLEVQGKLLRFLQSREVQPVGGAPVTVDVRVITATHRDLGEMVRGGTFREDLLHRIDVATIHIPPLRERGEDVLLLADHFLRRHCRAESRRHLDLGDAALHALTRYSFPGNVRELENLVHRLVIFASGPIIEAEDLPVAVPAGEAGPAAPRTNEELQAAKARAREKAERAVERRFLEQVLRNAKGNVSAAARAAGINRTHLHRLIAKHGIDPGVWRPGS